jgi:hypothetical protein
MPRVTAGQAAALPNLIANRAAVHHPDGPAALRPTGVPAAHPPTAGLAVLQVHPSAQEGAPGQVAPQEVVQDHPAAAPAVAGGNSCGAAVNFH